MKKLQVRNLHASVDKTPILLGVSLDVSPGKVHVVMGPNGSGKSTLAYTLMGHPRYTVSSGTITLGSKKLLGKEPSERAALGLFLAFQYPLEIPGVQMGQFLRSTHNILNPTKKLSTLEFRRLMLSVMEELSIESEFAKRYLNEGFSGGEKKKAEVLQMRLLRPKIVICDETDSGLDVDALKVVAKGIAKTVSEGAGALVITHYQRLLEYVKPDTISIMVDGKIVAQGAAELTEVIERDGYIPFTKAVVHA